MANNLICVVDDDQSIGRMLDRGLRAAGFDVAVFNSAEQLLESERLDESACVIADVHLPGMTGIEFQQQLRESGRCLPIILISGNTDERTANRALGAGAIAFFKKPFSIDSLLSTIQTIPPQLTTN